MDNVKKKLESGNSSIQIQAVQKLYKEVREKRLGKGTPITATTPEVSELKTLIESCTNENVVLCTSSAEAVVLAVEEGLVQFSYAINALLNLVPSARSLVGVVRALGELLLLEINASIESQKTYSCPYNIRSPPHPFITVLRNRPEHWLTIHQEITRLLTLKDERLAVSVVPMLAPFFRFVLLEPSQSSKHCSLRHCLQVALLQAAAMQTHNVQDAIITFIMGLLPALQISDMSSVAETTTFFQALCGFIASQSDVSKEHVKELSGRVLTLCPLLVSRGQDVSVPLYHLLQVVKTRPQAFCGDVLVGGVSELFHQVPSNSIKHLLSLCEVLVEAAAHLCPVVLGMLVLPLLQVVATPTYSRETEDKANQKRAGHLLAMIDTTLTADNLTCQEEEVSHESKVTADAYTLDSCTYLAKQFCRDDKQASDWLVMIQSGLSQSETVPRHVTNVVASLFLSSAEKPQLTHAIDTLSLVAKQDPSQGVDLLPLFLYRLGRVTEPQSRLQILRAIPTLATHKHTIGPILKTIQSLATSPKLKPLSVHLLTLLWQQQDRCYPYLHAAILEGATCSKTAEVTELTLAQAAAIYDICESRPHQHGEELLPPLSKILNNCRDESQTAAAALALQALQALCEAEAIDIQTAWAVLAAKLSADQRPVVIRRICELFSLVPALAVNSTRYEEFQRDVIQLLWRYTQSADTGVASSSYEALSSFYQESFDIEQLPDEVTSDFKALFEVQGKEEEEGVPQSTYIPGVCYTRLLNHLQPDSLPAFQVFLSSMIETEVKNLPRGIHNAAVRHQTASANHNKAVGAIPAFLLQQYEKNCQPGLGPPLAVSLLFCYDPALEVGRDGRPRKRHVVGHMKRYAHMLTTLLAEVPVQPSEWLRTMLLPTAWEHFMDRCFLAITEGHKAELQMQDTSGQGQGHSQEDEEEAKLKQDSAWMWARDHLVNTLKKTSRGNPTIQGNSVLALAGLARVLGRYVSSLDAAMLKRLSDGAPEHMSQAHWTGMLCDTILCVMDINYQPRGRIFNMCQQGTTGDRLAASVLARSCACVSLPCVVPYLLSREPERVLGLLEMLRAGLPGATGGADQSPVLLFHNSLSLGRMLAELQDANFADIAGTKGLVCFWQSVEALEKCCFSEEPNTLGAYLGLALCLTSMCNVGKSETRAHVSAMHEKLNVILGESDAGSTAFPGVCMATSLLTSTGYSANILPADVVKTTMEKLCQLHNKHPQMSGLCAALGTVCYGLNKAGYHGAQELSQALMSVWKNNITVQDGPALQRLACLNGILALCGASRQMIQLDCDSSSVGEGVALTEVVKLVSSLLTTSSDLGLQGSCAWQLGLLVMATTSMADTTTNAPSKYSYLPETSILRASVDYLLRVAKGNEDENMEHMSCVLSALTVGTAQVLPPLNWSALLTPLLRLPDSGALKMHALKLAISQSAASPSAALVASSWIVSPLFDSLEDDAKKMVYGLLPVLIKSVPVSSLQQFLNRGFLEPFTAPPGGSRTASVCLCVLEGLRAALEVHDPPQAVTLLLYQSLEQLYSKIHSTGLQLDLVPSVCACLAEVPDELVDKITQNSLVSMETFPLGMMVHCHLVGKGKQQLTWLNRCIDILLSPAISGADCDLLLWLLARCFQQQEVVETEEASSMAATRMQWLLELMGHLKNIAYGKVKIDTTPPQETKVLDFGVCIFAAAVSAWSGEKTALALGLDAQTDGNTAPWKVVMVTKHLMTCLPLAVGSLLERKPWTQMSSKVLDWLACMCADPAGRLGTPTKTVLAACQLGLRHQEEFKAFGVWSQVFS